MRILRLCAIVSILASALCAQTVSIGAISTTSTQAVITYSTTYSGGVGACTLQAADMDRGITIASASASSGTVTVNTVAPHGLLPGAIVRIEGTGVWDGWQTPLVTASGTTFTFASSTTGSAAAGNVGVLSDDVNTGLFAGSNLGSRAGNPSGTFALGLRSAPVASDSNRYSRALQANARYLNTFTCGSATQDFSFHTANVPVGDTHAEGPIADQSNPGQYAYPTVQWGNQYQALIDPLTGLRSYRNTGPAGTTSGTKPFITPLNQSGGTWSNIANAISGAGVATYVGGSGPAGAAGSLFLRADTLQLGGSYATDQSPAGSLDWVTVSVTNASISNAGCAGADCQAQVCLTVNATTCATPTKTITLTTTPTTFSLGTTSLMDLWQAAGTPPTISRVDASQQSGTVSVSGSTATYITGPCQPPGCFEPFNIKWGAGSTISLGGTSYTLTGLTNEVSATIASPPASGSYAYLGNNFGILIYKSTATADTISIGPTTYAYGSTAMATWPADSSANCGPPTTVNSVAGYYCMVGGSELWFYNSTTFVGTDLGQPNPASYYSPYLYSTSIGCGQSGSVYQWDPSFPNTWYCMYPVSSNSHRDLIQVAYQPPNPLVSQPGVFITNCALTTPTPNTPPCAKWTDVTPNLSGFGVDQVVATFNVPAYTSWNTYPSNTGLSTQNWDFGGIDPSGNAVVYTTLASQNTPGLISVFALGDRTPTGTTGNSVHIIASTNTYSVAPMSWCSLHDVTAPNNGWAGLIANSFDYTNSVPNQHYNMSLTANINASVTTFTVNGEPVRLSDGGFLQNLQVGDLLGIDSEVMQVTSVLSFPTISVLRARAGTAGVSHTTASPFVMLCGAGLGDNIAYWNAAADPTGANPGGATIITDVTTTCCHLFTQGAYPAPSLTISPNYLIRSGYIPPSQVVSPSTNWTVSNNPGFAGKFGVGYYNQTDSHPGPIFTTSAGTWSMDAHVFDGGDNGTANVANCSGAPFSQVGSTPVYKLTSASVASGCPTGILTRKIFNTIAFVGRFALVDVSGPNSVSTFCNTSSCSYEYCIVLGAGECVSGSAAGDIYVNAPYVSHNSCYYAGVANQGDDVNGICIANLGGTTANVVQVGIGVSDIAGSFTRRLGPQYRRWNQMNVYDSFTSTPDGRVGFGWLRWLDGIRHEIASTVLPPYPSADAIPRGTFQPVNVTVPAPRSGLSVSTALVEFGYGENAANGSYLNCISRQETCVAVASTINLTTPFYFETSETYSGLSCASGCTIAIPALGQRVLYYRVKLLNSGGTVVATGKLTAMVTP